MKPPDALLEDQAKSHLSTAQCPTRSDGHHFRTTDAQIHTHHCVLLDSPEVFAPFHNPLRTCPDLNHSEMPTLLPIDGSMDYSYSDEDIPNLIGTDDDDDGGGSNSLDGRRTPPDFRKHLKAIQSGNLSKTKMRQISFSCLDEPLPVSIQSLLMELGNEDIMTHHDLSSLNLNSIIDSPYVNDANNDLSEDLARWSN